MVAEAGTATSPDAACRALARTVLERAGAAPARVLDAEWMPRAPLAREDGWAGIRQGAPVPPGSLLPEHCRVRGYVAPQVRFDLRLPAATEWNGRLLVAACDGFCGALDPDYTYPGLLRGYATVTTDGGHAGAPGFDGVWAYGNRDAEVDFGHRAIHVVTRAARDLVAARYLRPARHAYLTGCSKGGQAGVMAALRHPEDFDGIVAGAPVLDYQGKAAIHFAWTVHAATDRDGRPRLSPRKIERLARTVLATCDGTDGTIDGIIDDPRACSFDPAVLACEAPSGAGADDCLTPADVDVVRRLYAPPEDSAGRRLYPAGNVLGSESDWLRWVVGREGQPSHAATGAAQYLRYLAFDVDPGAAYDVHDFDFDRDPARLRPLREVYDATGTDLAPFAARGGRLLLWHGTVDAAVSPYATTAWFDALAATLGTERVRGFARLFLVPGVAHCGGGAGHDALEALDAVVKWREEGIAPDALLAARERSGAARSTRMLRPYAPASRAGGRR